MKHNTFFANILLCALFGLTLLICVVVRAFLPAVILPEPDIPALTLISLAAHLGAYLLSSHVQHRYFPAALLSAAAFGLLPMAAGLLPLTRCLKTAAIGGVVFPVVGFLFSSLTSRVPSRGASVAGALGIYLASQGFAGIFL